MKKHKKRNLNYEDTNEFLFIVAVILVYFLSSKGKVLGRNFANYSKLKFLMITLELNRYFPFPITVCVNMCSSFNYVTIYNATYFHLIIKGAT